VLPLLVGASFAQISELADNVFASMIGEGGIASRTFAKKIKDLPLEIAPYTLSVVLFPYFSFLASTGQRTALQSLFNKSAHATAIAFAALGVCMWFLAEPIVSVALERGAFGAAARQSTAWPLQLYALGMTSFAVEMLLVNYYFALADTRTPIAAGLLGVAIDIGLSALLIGSMGVGGVALALTVAKTIKVVLLLGLLPRKGHAIAWPAISRGAARLAVAGAVATVGLWAFTSVAFVNLHDLALWRKALLLAAGTMAGGGLFLGTLAVIGARERAIMLAAANLLWTWRQRGVRP
jgi:putative peptidoglycan lipid II flippase